MFRVISNFMWLFLVGGIFFLAMDSLRVNHEFSQYYMSALKIYLFGVGAYLVLKRVVFYRLKGEVNVISLVKQSDYQNNLLLQGVMLSVLGLVFVRMYGSLKSFDTLVIGLLAIYYWGQVSINANPTIYLDDHSFFYDDYFVDQWSWAELQRIDLGNEKLRLVSPAKDFELDFDLVDGVDYRKLTREVERNVLDGEFGKDKTSKSLVEIIENYAAHHGIKTSIF